MPPPAKKNRGGRPRLVWSAPQCRKLVRLYLMTDLTLEEIKTILCSDGFSCSTRHIQDKLKEWIPNIKERWRDHRPSGSSRKSKQKNRLLQFTQSNANKLSKYQRIQSRLRRDRDGVATAARSSELQLLPTANTISPNSPSKNTLAIHNDLHCTARTPSHAFIGPLSLRILNHASAQTAFKVLTEISSDNHSGDKDVVEETSATTDPVFALPSQATAGNISDERDIGFSDLVISNTLGFLPGLKEDDDTIYGLNTLHGLKRRHDDVSSMSSGRNSLRASLLSRTSDSIRHIKAVIARSISWCSSPLYASSIASGFISNQSRIFLSRHESLIWEELIDDTHLSSGSAIPDYKEASLKYRPCCGNALNDMTCKKCGARQAHRLARLQDRDLSALESPHTKDHFGNTILHHAGAGGNLQGISRYLSRRKTTLLIHDRNTSGETFLHVLNILNRAQLPHYIAILKMASKLKFSFCQRDHHGRTVAHMFQLLASEHDLESALTDEVYQIMNIRGTWLDNHGNCFESPAGPPSNKEFFNFWRAHKKDTPVMSQEVDVQYIADDYDENGDTRLISALKNWATHSLTDPELSQLIDKADINSRDRQGYTALAISVTLGLYGPSLALLRKGANPNSRSYQGTGVYARCTNYAARAIKRRDNSLNATIMTCAHLLADHGAVAKPTPYDEFTKPDLESDEISRNDLESILGGSPDTAHRAQTPANELSPKVSGQIGSLLTPAALRQRDRKVTFVDNLVSSSAQIVEAIWPLSSIVSRSEMRHKGVLPLHTFIQETLRRSRTSYSTLQVALYYLILVKPHVPKHDFTVEQPEHRNSTRALQCGRRMFLAALILATKYLQERNYSARAWSKISGLNTQEINRNELTFLRAVNWQLHIRDAVFQRWTDIVLKYTPQHPPSSDAPSHLVAEQEARWTAIILQLNPGLDNVEGVSSSTSTQDADFPISAAFYMLQKSLAAASQLQGERPQTSSNQNGAQNE